MKRHLNTLFITTQGAYLSKEGETILVRVQDERKLQMPLHNLAGIVCFGNILCSPFLMGACARKNVSLSFLTEHGRFLSNVRGPTQGNVLLRREQYRRADHADTTQDIARAVVSAKILNTKAFLTRAARKQEDPEPQDALKRACAVFENTLRDLKECPSLDVLRGLEGHAARTYFAVFDHLIRYQKDDFTFYGRSRRPPKDRVNALLSFLYTILSHDIRAALECVGLDPAVGYLHRERPGRPSLALDLMEEFRTYLVDRLVLGLINKKQIQGTGFTIDESGAVFMDEDTRRTVLVAYQKRKQETVTHPFLEEKTSVGLLFHLQALLLARFLRGDLDAYPPFISR